MLNFSFFLSTLFIFISPTAWANKEEITVIHVVSKGMPLSLKSYRNLKVLEGKMSFKLVVLQDSFFAFPPSELKTDGIAPDHGYLAQRGAFLHFPSTLMMKGVKSCGSLIPGYKAEAAFKLHISSQVKNCHERKFKPLPINNNIFPIYAVTEEITIPSNSRYFFKPIGDEGFIYHDGTRGYINLVNKKRVVMVPGPIDHFPSPDLEIFAIPDPLRFFDLTDIVNTGLDDMRTSIPVLEDPSMTEDYESIGILAKSSDEKIYRVITGYDVAGVFKDYRFDLKSRLLSPLSPRKALCGHLKYSVPMISKSALLFGLKDNETEFSAVKTIGKDGTECKEILNLGRSTGKIAFDYQDKNILFISGDIDKLGLYMVNLETKVWSEILSCDDCRYTFPDFTPAGDIVVMKTMKSSNEKKIIRLKSMDF